VNGALRSGVVAATLVVISTVALAGGYLLTFDGAPPMPTAYRPSLSFDSVVHVNDDDFTPVNAGHGPSCEAPPATHPVQSFDNAVFQCKDHLMTSLFAPGYGVIYLTPNQLADFSGGEVVIGFDVSTLRTSERDWIDLWVTPWADQLADFSGGEVVIGFDVSTLRTSERDWIDLWVTPWADQLALPLDNFLPDLNGDPRNSVHIKMDNGGGGSIFRPLVVRNFAVEEPPFDARTPLESVVTPSAVTRTHFELRLSRTHLKFGVPAIGYWPIDTNIADLGWSSGVVQFGHHSYNPTKDGGSNQPDTWHWDNFSISQATPFTIIQSDRRRADAGAPKVTFAAPAPGGANLRFDARGGNIQVSFDNGASWRAATRPAVAKADQDEVFKSYWTAMPAGATSATFKGADWFAGPWAIRDASIFSLAAPGTNAPPAPTVVPGAGQYHSSWVDQAAYPILAPGQTADVFVRFRNTGTAAWVKDVFGQQANLGINGDDRRFAAFAVNWPTPDRPAVQSEAVIEPGQIGTFRFTVRGPADAGMYALHLRPVIDGLTWMEDQGVFFNVTADLGYHSSWVSQSAFPTLRPGELSGPLSISFRNTGTRPWIRGGLGQQANLGIAGEVAPSLGATWPAPDRPATQTELMVTPGDTATFTFQVRAPTLPGAYRIPVRPVVDGTTWMEDQGAFFTVVVAE